MVEEMNVMLYVRAAWTKKATFTLQGAATEMAGPMSKAVQPDFRGTNDGRWGNGDAIIAKLQPTGSAEQAAADGRGKQRR